MGFTCLGDSAMYMHVGNDMFAIRFIMETEACKFVLKIAAMQHNVYCAVGINNIGQ